MALHLGELSIGLELENDRLRAGLGQAKRELETLPPTAQREMVKVSRVMEDEGRKSGGALSRGINQGLVRNSPLIVAGVSAALAAGAPVMIASATTLFAGVGAVAAAQSLEVRSAWQEMGHAVRDGAVADAAVLIPTYVGMADKIGASFERLRPQLREAFVAAGPQISAFTDSLTRAAENAMPGLVRAVQSAGPVVAGLGSFLESVGTGLTDFFDAMSAHAPAAGAAFAAIGDVLKNLLPTLGELLGTGAEIAAVVLPPLASALGVVASAASQLGPLLPAIVTGLAALKIANTMGDGLAKVGAKLIEIGAGSAIAEGGLTRAGGALLSLGRAVPIVGAVGAALGVMVVSLVNAREATTDYVGYQSALVQALQASSGAISDNVRVLALQQAAETEIADGKNLQQYAQQVGVSMKDLQAALLGNEPAIARVNAAIDAYIEKTGLAATASGEDSGAIAELGIQGDVAKDAIAELSPALQEAARQQEELERATTGTTAALVAQAQQAVMAADSEYAYRVALEGVDDDVRSVAEAIRDHGAASEEASDAQLTLEGTLRAAAAAAASMATEALPASATELERNAVGSQAYLAELLRLRDQMGSDFPAALQTTIANLQSASAGMNSTTVAAIATTAQMRDLGLSVVQVPNEKTVIINAPTADQRQRLIDLGYQVTAIPGSKNVVVTADTGPASAALAALVARNYTIQVRAVMPDLNGAASGSGRMGTAATGGRIGDVVRGFSGGGKLSGPGTSVSDSIPALTYSGKPLRVSDDEWVIKARSARQYGDGVMAAINAGTAEVSTPGRSTGGRVSTTPGPVSTSARTGPLFHADKVEFVSGTPQDVEALLAYRARTRGW